jgi:putative phosphoesterase
MEIGLLSDTHGYLDPRIFKLFADCDEVWHAGDFGTGVAEALQAGFPVLRGVYGNIDDQAIRTTFPRDLRFALQDVDVWITHIAGRPGRYDGRVAAILKRQPPDVLICGHSHILHVERDARFGNLQYLNPGAAGHLGFHQQRTLLKFTLAGGQLSRLRLIELGPRGRKSVASGRDRRDDA